MALHDINQYPLWQGMHLQGAGFCTSPLPDALSWGCKWHQGKRRAQVPSFILGHWNWLGRRDPKPLGGGPQAAETQNEISKWEGKKLCTKRELLSLIGQLQHACCVVEQGISFWDGWQSSLRESEHQDTLKVCSISASEGPKHRSVRLHERERGSGGVLRVSSLHYTMYHK